MYGRRSAINPPAIIFSDLDGTMLDHDSYAFDAALPALHAVRERGIPLILATSKTLAETVQINAALGNHQAMIVENGSALCLPLDLDYAIDRAAHQVLNGHTIVRLAPPHRIVRDFIERQRAKHGWRLRGFGDMDTTEVAGMTGLDETAADRAKQRLCGEPFVWLDDTEAFARFKIAAGLEGLTITQGGRFHHLMGGSDKAHAVQSMRVMMGVDQFQGPVIALGDSDNDRAMLEAADIAVVIRRHDGTHLNCRGIKRTLYAKHSGPHGWNTAVLQILGHLSVQSPPN